MKFTCTKENLSQALDMVVGIAQRKVNLPILAHVLLRATESQVEVLSTDLEIAVRAALRAKIDEPGEFTVPAKTLGDFVHLLPDVQVQITLEDNELVLQAGASSTKIKGTPVDDFPVIPQMEQGHEYQVEREGFKRTLGSVVIAAAKNDIRPELAGVFFGFFTERHEGLIVTATDSYRLAEARMGVQGKDEARCIVPQKTVAEMIRLLGLLEGEEHGLVHVAVANHQIALRSGGVEMTSRLVEGTYPEYYQIIPASFKTTAVFPKDQLTQRVKAASLFTPTGVNAVSLDVNASEKTIGVSSTSTQAGEHHSEIEAETTGEENSILLNHRYVLDGLNHMEGEWIELKLNDGQSPCMFQSKEKKEYLYLVMPIRQ